VGIDQRVAIVTGGTRGLGAAISQRLIARGAHVTAVYATNDEAATKFARSVESGPGTLTVRQADIRDPASCQTLVDEVLDTRGRIDHLVNNAGLLIEAPVRHMTLDQWDQALQTNLSAAFYMSRAVITPMIDAKFGRIVNISSVTAIMGNPVEAGYGAAKAGLLGFTRSLARETARKGVTVNVIIPGVFETEMSWSMPADAQERIRALIPLGRRGDPDELAHGVTFLLDDDASYITGSIITVDGGLSMGG
jgi:NAD(P)-dependent dehydrogenase (short-subunit alcohol dehydrogenase family)